jgi:hypothetical protein
MARRSPALIAAAAALASMAIAPSRAGAEQGDPHAARAAAMKERIARKAPGSRFTVIVEKPFVIAGDEAPERVRRRRAGTVRRAVRFFRDTYFARDPDRVIEIWLFRDAASYRNHARRLFGHSPDTPFGYYSPAEGALIMNIGTGGGTLIHELVHPFVEADLPNCPAWLNEGLGSLYEATSARGGKLVALTNWRLPGLKEAIEGGRVPSIRALTATSDDEFYGDDSGVHYAQARYLLYYLERRGLLDEFYSRFKKERRRDPTGYRTLKRVLEVEDMADFEERWQRWVLGLSWR